MVAITVKGVRETSLATETIIVKVLMRFKHQIYSYVNNLPIPLKQPSVTDSFLVLLVSSLGPVMADSITATSATTIDGKAIKLRASCDACNESKVRCNQSKPGCARCERLRVPCVYGLSRRTHKSAPRVGASSPLALPALPPLPPPPQPPPPPPPSSQPQPLSSQSQPLSSQATHHPPITGDGSSTLFSLIPASLQLEDPDVSACLPLSSSQAVVDMYDMDMPFDWTLNPTAAAFASHLSFLDSPGIATPSNSIPMSSLGSEPMDNWPSTSSPLCNCINDFLKQLLSSPSSLDTLGTSWETYVSHLRQVINVAERCVQCNCISRDEFSLGKGLLPRDRFKLQSTPLHLRYRVSRAEYTNINYSHN